MHIAMWSPAWPLEKYQNGIVTYVHWMKRELPEAWTSSIGVRGCAICRFDQ